MDNNTNFNTNFNNNFMDKKMIKEQKEFVGKQLTDFIQKSGKSYYRLSKETGLIPSQIKAIQNGSKSYTFNSLLAFIRIGFKYELKEWKE